MLFCSFLNILNSQCPNESVVLLTQSDIENFSQQYPDCTYLETNLFIGVETFSASNPNCENAVDPITDLSGLDQITYIRDTLLIQCNNSLTSISGLNSIDSVGSIYISYNEELLNIVAFENLTNVREKLTIVQNENLSSITGFRNIITARNIRISADAVINLSKLNHTLALTIIGDVEMLHMDSIQTLVNLNILSNNIIENFDFLSGRELEIPQFTISQISQPISFRGLELLITANLNIFYVANVDFSYLESLEDIAIFRLSNCENCTSLSGLENINFSNSIRITSNPFLTTLDGLSSAKGEIRRLTITGCAQLDNIDALSSISSISEVLEVSNNPSLNNCAIKPICRALSNDLIVLTIENNGQSNTCNTSEQILMGCADKETYLDYAICDGDTITLNSVEYTTVGLYYQDFVNEQGLDSILVIDIVESDDCSDEEEDPTLCPILSRPGMQIDRLDDDTYNIMYLYGIKRMYLRDIKYTELVNLIAYHKVEKDILFDFDTFALEQYCERAEVISKGEIYQPNLPSAPMMKYKVEVTMSEIDFFQNFVLTIRSGESVKL